MKQRLRSRRSGDEAGAGVANAAPRTISASAPPMLTLQQTAGNAAVASRLAIQRENADGATEARINSSAVVMAWVATRTESLWNQARYGNALAPADDSYVPQGAPEQKMRTIETWLDWTAPRLESMWNNKKYGNKLVAVANTPSHERSAQSLQGRMDGAAPVVDVCAKWCEGLWNHAKYGNPL